MFTNLRNQRFSSKSRRTSRQRRLRLESLEQRALMAGDSAPGPSLPTEPFPDDSTTVVVPASTVLGEDGILRVYGTENGDVIRITDDPVVIAEPSINQTIEAPALHVTIEGANGQILLSQSFVFPNLVIGINSIEVYAGKGNDFVENNTGIASMLFGGLGNDTLYGGSGDDELYGEEGNDGLFGGAGGTDLLLPGSGDNRNIFVVDWNDYTWDFGSASSATNTLITLYDEPAASIDYPNYPGQPVTFQPGQWSLNEVKAIDQVLMFLHHEMNNSTLLNDAYGSALSIHRTGEQNPHVSNFIRNAVNDNGEIYLTSTLFAKGPDWVTQVFLHEIGHNWEDENPQWETFKQISGWTDVNPNDSATYSPSHDGDWWYESTADFARAYGSTNPKEDFATAFAAYWVQQMGAPYQGVPAGENGLVGASAIPGKIAFMADWINGIKTPYVEFASVDDFSSPTVFKQSERFGDSAMGSRSSERLATGDTLVATRDPAALNYLLSKDDPQDKPASNAELAESNSPDAIDQAFEELFGEDDVDSPLKLPKLAAGARQ